MEIEILHSLAIGPARAFFYSSNCLTEALPSLLFILNLKDLIFLFRKISRLRSPKIKKAHPLFRTGFSSTGHASAPYCEVSII